MIETTAKAGALWDDASQSMEDRLAGAIGMIDFQAGIIANKNKELGAKDELIALLHTRINSQQSQLYQMSGDMNILAMELYNIKSFKKEVENGDVLVTDTVHVTGLGRIAIAYLGSGVDEGEEGAARRRPAAEATDATYAGSAGAQGEGPHGCTKGSRS